MTDKKINLQEYDLLQEMIANGIIDMNQAKKQNEDMKRKKILAEHPYSIYQTPEGNWCTYLPDKIKKNKRKRIKRAQKEALEDAIVEFYNRPKDVEGTGPKTLREIYPLWLAYTASTTSATTTIRRYDVDWNGWLINDPIVDVPIGALDYITLKAWANELVKGKNMKNKQMTKKQYLNLSIVIRGCFQYAYDKELISQNPFLRVKVSKKLFYVKEKDFDDDRDQVFKEDEIQKLRELALGDYRKTRDEVALAVFIVSYTGLRAAEVCALKWKSICGDMEQVRITSQIVRLEKRDKEGNWLPSEWINVNHAKSVNGHRNVYIPIKARDILREHKKYKNPESDDELIFSMPDGSFIHNTQTYKRTIKYARKIDTYRKGTHKLRKTYLSTLYDGGIHESTLTKIGGQAIDGKVLHKHYLKDRNDMEAVNKKIDELLD